MSDVYGECLSVQGITKRYGDLVAVNALTFSVRKGEVFGFLGPNGAGKTTSITVMCGLTHPDSGDVYLFGENAKRSSGSLHTRIGVCPQNVVVWPRLTCIEQLEFMGQTYGVQRTEARQRAGRLLEALGLAEKSTTLARKLSGGMQRRLSIALALVHEPEIVVLDEPEAGLDPQSRVLVREYIVALARNQGKTIIFTTHNMDEAERIVDRVAIIDHGKLLELDTPDALKRRVGGGDTLEIRLSEGGHDVSESAQVQLRTMFPDAKVTQNELTLRQLSVLERLPAILSRLQSTGLALSGIQLRESSLEDVFISLTGRSLRQ